MPSFIITDNGVISESQVRVHQAIMSKPFVGVVIGEIYLSLKVEPDTMAMV